MKQTVSLTLLHTCTLRIPRSPPCAKLTKDNLEATTVTMITITSTAIFPSATPRISIHFTVLHAGKYKGWGGGRGKSGGTSSRIRGRCMFRSQFKVRSESKQTQANKQASIPSPTRPTRPHAQHAQHAQHPRRIAQSLVPKVERGHGLENETGEHELDNDSTHDFAAISIQNAKPECLVIIVFLGFDPMVWEEQQSERHAIRKSKAKWFGKTQRSRCRA